MMSRLVVCSIYLVLSIYINSSSVFSIDSRFDQIKELHQKSVENLCYSYNCLVTHGFTVDTKTLENLSKYKEQASKGELIDQLTPGDIDVWYDFLTKRIRTFPMEFMVMAHQSNLRLTFHAPKLTYKAHETLGEYITNKEQKVIFNVCHKNKIMQLIPIREDTKTSVYLFFNPVELMFPLIAAGAEIDCKINNVGEYIDFNYISTDPNSDIKTIRALLDPSKNYVSIKTLIQSTKSELVKRYYYSEQDSFIENNGQYYPEKQTIINFFQYTDKSPFQGAAERKQQILPNNVPVLFEDLNIENIKIFNCKYDGIIDYKMFDQKDLGNELFWPEVQVGYKWQDDRYPIIHENGTETETSKMQGNGPYIFPITQ